MWIFLDDVRPCPQGFVLARNVDECMKLLRVNKENVKILSLDHDLGDETMETGYDLVKMMVNEGLFADEIYFHTANNEGRKNMLFYLLNAIKHEAMPNHIVIHPDPITYK